MDAKLVNPFVDAITSVLPMMGFATPKRTGMAVHDQTCKSLGISMIVGFTKGLRGNIVYNMTDATGRYIASKMMMGMPVDELNEMAQSALSELSNMLTANAATNLTAMGMNVDISTPSLTIGQDFKIKISSTQYLAVNMDVGDGNILELSIAVQ